MSPAPVHPDYQLARRCARGDESARRAFFVAHRARVHTILYRVLGTNREMEDLAQEAFGEIFRSLGAYRGEAALGTWIDRVATRVAYRWLRRRPAPTLRLAPADVPMAEDDPERTAWLREVTRRLYAILDALPEKHRIAFALHVVDGRPMREVAVLMDATVVATKTRVWRARRQVEKRALRDPLLTEYLRGSA